MAYKLTAKVADPLTGQQNSYIGWHFTVADALDVLASAIWLETQTPWSYNIFANPDNHSLLRMSLIGPIGNFVNNDGNLEQVTAQFIVNDTDYYIYDSGHVKVMTQADAEADYDIAAYTLPPPPPPQGEAPQPAMGMPEQPLPPPPSNNPVPPVIITPPTGGS
jgi:hypothetical protein